MRLRYHCRHSGSCANNAGILSGPLINCNQRQRKLLPTNALTRTRCLEGQAQAQLSTLREMVKALDGGEEWEGMDPEEAIAEDPLEVSIRADWHSPGGGPPGAELEYKILLCTGGPAVRIIGELGEYSEPQTARIEYQDWGTPWTELYTNSEEDEALLTYACQFYFGE